MMKKKFYFYTYKTLSGLEGSALRWIPEETPIDEVFFDIKCDLDEKYREDSVHITDIKKID
jgi:hypothetical protein